MITVPFCVNCNRIKEPFDHYLRDVLISHHLTLSHPTARKIRSSKLMRSRLANRSQLYIDAVTEGNLTTRESPYGIYTGRTLGVPLDKSRLANSMRYILQGIAFHINGTRIPKTYVTTVAPVNEYATKYVWSLLQSSNKFYYVSVGETVFDGYVTFWDKDLNVGVAYLRFYKSLIYFVTTCSQENLSTLLLEFSSYYLL